MPPVNTLQEILDDPGYQALDNPGDQMAIRRAFYRKKTTDPGFKGLEPAERHSIARDIFFPPSEYPETENVARPRLSIGEEFKGGLEQFKAGGHPPGQLLGAGKQALGLMRMAGSPLAPMFNLFTAGGERVSDYLQEKGFRRTADVAGAITSVADVPIAMGITRGLHGLGRHLKRKFPTVGERIKPVREEAATKLQQLKDTEKQLTAEVAPGVREQRLSDLDKLATGAQAKTAEAQARRTQQIPAARRSIEERGARDIADVEQQLATQQQRVGMEAAQAGAPVSPKRMNFEKRYRDLERTADQIPARPVNLNAASYKITREPGLQGVPTTPAERSAASISRTISEGDVAQIEEEITGQVRRMLTAPDTKAADYNAITKLVLGDATASDVTVGELLRTRRRFREAQRVAYAADHKNLARQFGVMDDAISKDIAAADKRIARLAAKVDKDYFSKKAVDWYAEGVDQAFDPAKGVWDRKRFTKWWEKHADSTNNDRDLRRLLGSRYEQTKGLVDDMQKATELNIEQAAKVAARNVQRRTGVGLRQVGAREKQLEKLGKQTGEQIQIARKEGREAIAQETVKKEAQLAGIPREARLIEQDIKRQIEEITGRAYTGQFHKAFGSIALVTGAGKTIFGVVTGSPARLTAGLATAGGGLLTVLTHGALLKMINSASGLSIFRRLLRAAPGTGEAIAASYAATRFLKSLEGKEEEVEPGAPAAAAKSSAAKEALLQKYGIQ